MSFYDAFEKRAEEMEKEAKGKGAIEWMRRRLNPTRAERLYDVGAKAVKTKQKEYGRKFDEAFPTRAMTMKRKAKEGLVSAAKGTAAAGLAGGKTVAKGVASGAKTLKSKLTPAPKLTRIQKATQTVKGIPANLKSKFQGLSPKVKANWNNLSQTQKAVALGVPAAALGAGATYAAMRD